VSNTPIPYFILCTNEMEEASSKDLQIRLRCKGNSASHLWSSTISIESTISGTSARGFLERLFRVVRRRHDGYSLVVDHMCLPLRRAQSRGFGVQFRFATRLRSPVTINASSTGRSDLFSAA
jgi:hypothetical protein